MQDVKKPQVAILVDDLQAGKELGKIFRKLNIIPDCFNSVESFLIAQIESGFDLCILDIKMCVYEQKPLVQRAELRDTQLSFYHTQDSAKLLRPTTSLDHLGYIDNSFELTPQLRNILIKFNKRAALNRDHLYYKNYHDSYKAKQERISQNMQAIQEKSYFQDVLFDLLKDININSSKGFFSDIVSDIFDTKDFIKGYSYLELNELRNRLISCEELGQKRVDIPSLWLGKSLVEIDDDSISLAQNVFSSLTSSSVISLSLSSDSERTCALLLIEVSEETMFNVDWKVLESSLNALYIQSQAKKSLMISDTESKSAFDLMSKLNKGSATEHLISIDLSDVVDFVCAKPDSRFNWSMFWQDFQVYLAQVVSQDQVYPVSLDTVVFSVPAEIFDETYAATVDICKRYSLYKFFENTERFEVSGITLSVQEVPYSINALAKINNGSSVNYGPLHGEALL